MRIGRLRSKGFGGLKKGRRREDKRVGLEEEKERRTREGTGKRRGEEKNLRRRKSEKTREEWKGTDRSQWRFLICLG